MRFHRNVGLALVALLMVWAQGCGDSPTGGGGTTDTAPPGIASVTSVDVRHLQVTFSESVKEQTAEMPGNYRIVERAPAPAAPAGPGDEVPVNSAVLAADGKTVTLTTSNPMQALPYDLYVSGVEDLAGNKISGEANSAFTGTNTPDTTTPTILSRIPAPDATNVAIGAAVVVQFSESMDYSSVLSAFSWTSTAGPVSWEARSDDNATFSFTPLQPLARNTAYTVTVGSEAQDWAGNHLATTIWSFRTTSQVDNTPPTLVASTPANGATRVSRATNISLTFSEPVDPSIDEILVSPEPSDGVLDWSTDGRTFTFDPDVDLLADTQYALLIPPGGVRDLAGNGNTNPISVVFTTGTAFASGAFSGTLAGAPGSGPASNPAGALVVAADQLPFAVDYFGIAGFDVVGSGGSYSVDQLPDGTYWPIAFKETNGDGRLNPELGDAIGAYGFDFASMSGEPDSVTIVGGGSVSGIDFGLFDPVALSGTVVYEGSMYPSCCYPFFVGVFDTTGFDPGDPLASEPLYTTEGGIPNYPEWYINQYEQGLAPGTYYIGAFMDLNYNTAPDVGEPMEIYGSGGVPTTVTLADGSDLLGIHFRLQDPTTAVLRVARPVRWPSKPDADSPQVQAFRRAVAVMRKLDQERGALLTP